MVDLRDQENFELSPASSSIRVNQVLPSMLLVPALSSHTAMPGVAHKPRGRLEHLSMSECIWADIIHPERQILPSGRSCSKNGAWQVLFPVFTHPVSPLGLHGSGSALLITHIPVVITKMSKSTFA